MSETDKAWLAAMVEGEGTIYILKQKKGMKKCYYTRKSDGVCANYKRREDTYSARLAIGNTQKSIIDKCLEIATMGHTGIVKAKRKARFDIYYWRLSNHPCKQIIKEIYPYLVSKRHQARLLLNCPLHGEMAEDIFMAIKDLHNMREVLLDFPYR